MTTYFDFEGSDSDYDPEDFDLTEEDIAAAQAEWRERMEAEQAARDAEEVDPDELGF